MKKKQLVRLMNSKIHSAKNRAYSNDLVRRKIHKSRFFSNLWKVKWVGQNNMDAEVLKFLNWENGYFIELGASDGIRFSNTLHLELYHGWKGVLIEPSPIEFEKLKLNRSNLNSFENCVCVENGFKGETLELIYSGLMTVDTNKKLGVTSPEEHAEAGAAFINIDTYRFQVRALTLTCVLVESESPRDIDFLSLDVEGSELNVLKGLDLDLFIIKFILIETRDIEIINSYLIKFNYNLVARFSDQDFLFEKFSNSKLVPRF